MMDQIPERMDSKFRFVLVAATRAEQLMRGARPKLEVRESKPTVQAMAEVTREVLAWEYGPAPEPEVEEEVVEVEEAAEDAGEEE